MAGLFSLVRTFLIIEIGCSMETETIVLILALIAFLGGPLALGLWIRRREGRLIKLFRSWRPDRFVPGDIEAKASFRYRPADAQPKDADEST